MKKSPLILAALLTASAPLDLSAATVFWDSNGVTPGAGAAPAGIWGTDAFWSTDLTGSSATAAWVPGDTATFAAGTDAIGAYTVTLGAAQTAAGLVVEEGTVSLAGSALTIGAGTIRIDNGAKLSIPSTTNIVASAGANLNLEGGTMRSTVNGAGSTFVSANFSINVGALGGTVETANTGSNSSIFAGTIKGPGNTLTKTGSGEFRYQGTGLPNTTYAKLVVNQGLFRLGFASSISDERGFGAVPVVFTSDAITLSGGGSIGTSFAAANSVLHANRGVTLAAGGGAINGSMTIPGAITGPGSLSHLTTGTVILNGNSDYGGITFVNLGIVQIGSANALGTAAGDTQVLAGAEIRIDGAASTFTLSEPFQIAGTGGGGGGAITIQNSSAPTISGPVTLTADSTVTVSSTATGTFNNANAFTSLANQNLTLQGGSGTGGGGTISGIISLGSGGLTKLQGGRWTLTGVNPYSGTTTIGAGTLQLGNGLAGNDGTISNSLSIVNNASLIFNRFGSVGYSGAISGTGSVTKTGVGTQTLSGANTYTGATVIGAGVLSVATIGNGGVASGNLGSATSAATNLVFDGGTLQYTGATASTDRNFTINTGKTAIFDIAGNELTLTGASTSTDGALTKIGAGILTLAGANLYSGLTEVDLGTIRLAASERISDLSNLRLNGGTFDSGGFNETLGTLDDDASSILDFGSGTSALAFADSDAQSWAGILTVVNWTAGLDTFRVGIDGVGFDAQLAQIQFADFGNAPGQIDANGFITPFIVPEPSSALLFALGGFGLLSRPRRRA